MSNGKLRQSLRLIMKSLSKTLKSTKMIKYKNIREEKSNISIAFLPHINLTWKRAGEQLTKP